MKNKTMKIFGIGAFVIMILVITAPTGIAVFGDIDGDGIPDEYDPDMDGDGIDNELDGDMDGDGVDDRWDDDPYDPGIGGYPPASRSHDIWGWNESGDFYYMAVSPIFGHLFMVIWHVDGSHSFIDL